MKSCAKECIGGDSTPSNCGMCTLKVNHNISVLESSQLPSCEGADASRPCANLRPVEVITASDCSGGQVLQGESLQDIISFLRLEGSEGSANLLIAADLLVQYHNRPAHEITLKDMEGGKRYFPLYLSFLRVPLESIDHLTPLVSELIATMPQLAGKAKMTKRIPVA